MGSSTNAPPRPLLAAAAALAGGGLLALGSAAWAGPGARLAVALAIVAGCAWVARRGRPAPARWVLALFLLATWRGLAPELLAPLAPDTARAPLVGSWNSLGRERGWIGEGLLPAGRAPRLELAGGAPRAGELVRVLHPGAPVPWPRGPAAAPRSPDHDFPHVLELRPDQLVRLAPAGGTEPLLAPGRAALGRVRAALGRRADTLDALDTRGLRGLARALLIGDSSELEPDLRDLFTRTGTRHLLAVSGLHVGLVALALALPLGRLVARGAGARAGILATALVLLVYAPLAGGAAPVVRAALAGLLAALAPGLPGLPGRREPDGRSALQGLGRAADPRSLWGLALLLECLADPAAPLRTGVRLSYLGTLGLILLYRPCRAALGGGAGARAPSWLGRPSVATLLARTAGRWGRGALAASLAASLATLPDTWARFGEWAPAGILLTPLALPFVALLLPALWIAVLAPHATLLGLVDAGDVARAAADGLVGVLSLGDGLPGTPWLLPERPHWFVAACALLTARALLAGGAWRRWAALASGALLLPWALAAARLELHALDVGHGTAVVLRAPGLPLLLFDAGSRDRPQLARRALAPLLARWETTRPVVVLSHADRDHAGALRWVVRRCLPRLWVGPLPPELAGLVSASTPRLDPGPGRVELGTVGGPRLVLLRGAEGGGNEGSRALLIETPGTGAERPTRVLLTGDAEAEGLAGLLDACAGMAPVDVLLLPHHGSDTALLGRLLGVVRPGRIWISTSREPDLGPELTRREVPWQSTHSAGPLCWPRTTTDAERP